MNAYTLVNSQTVIHDTNGNMTSGNLGGAATSLTYDKENRLRSTTIAGVTTSYVYDALGRLTSRTEGATQELLTWSSWTLLAREVFSNNALTETFRYTWGLDLSGTLEGAGGVGGLLCVERNTPSVSTWDARYPHYDANGNIIALTNSTGVVSAKYRYDAFGNQILSQDLDSTGWNTKNIHGFSTKPQWASTKLHYYGYRWYDASNGRWINRDPIEEEGDENLYEFVGNEGVSFVDDLGNNPAAIRGLIGAGKFLFKNGPKIAKAAVKAGNAIKNAAAKIAGNKTAQGAAKFGAGYAANKALDKVFENGNDKVKESNGGGGEDDPVCKAIYDARKQSCDEATEKAKKDCPNPCNFDPKTDSMSCGVYELDDYPCGGNCR